MGYTKMSGDEFIKKVLAGETNFYNIQLPEGFDLSGHDGFAEMNKYLSGHHKLVISRSDMRGIKAEGLYLGGAWIEQVNLNGAFLQKIWLSGAHLPYSYLKGTVLRNAICEGTTFWCTQLEGADVAGACFTEAVFEMAKLVGVKNLEKTDSLEYARFHMARVTSIERKIIEDILRLRPLFYEVKAGGE